MGQQQSKDELLYQQVNYGNIEGIKSLRSDGAGLEWIDKEGKTPLILACMNPELINVAKTLIELGANVNAYRPGRHAGTPLHHAAKRGLEQTVKLLISNGANALMMNDDCVSPLGVAREKGYANVVRAIEGHICLFSGWLREFYGPGFLGLLAPQLLSRKVWVVILPCGSRNFTRPLKLELAIYVSPQDAQPRTTIALWKANLEEPKYNQADSSVVISDISNNKSLLKLGPVDESDKEQLKRFCNACKGIPQVVHAFHPQAPTVLVSAPPVKEDMELAMAINASLQSSMQESQVISSQLGSGGHASTSGTTPTDDISYNCSVDPSLPASHKGSTSKSEVQEVIPSGNPDSQSGIQSFVPTTLESLNPAPSPSAPPMADAEFDAGPIHYPSIDSSLVDLSSPATESFPAVGKKQDDEASSSCVICLDAPVEGACIPCGHMAGCMSCLNGIKAKKWGCPVCRAKIDQVIRLYAV
ncbi:hypothetical protein ACET3Z_029485 [Daucus carota]